MNKLLSNEIRKDIYRYYGKYTIPLIIKLFNLNPGIRYIIQLRKTHFYKSKSSILYYINRFKLEMLSKKYLFQIPYSTNIGPGFYIGHYGTIIINSKSIIGSNVNIAPGVIIGQTNRGENKGVPIIGNRVWIGANAVIVGKISIGDNVLVAPNSYVNFNVPSNSIVIGNPGIIKSRMNATEFYINNLI